jgi:metal-responsive CopG/Arc/MetJ family transcriptional regulator
MKRILVSLPDGVFGVIRDLKGELGESDSEVVRNIVIAYLSEQGFFSQTSIRGIASRNRRNANEKKQKQ